MKFVNFFPADFNCAKLGCFHGVFRLQQSFAYFGGNNAADAFLTANRFVVLIGVDTHALSLKNFLQMCQRQVYFLGIIKFSAVS